MLGWSWSSLLSLSMYCDAECIEQLITAYSSLHIVEMHYRFAVLCLVIISGVCVCHKSKRRLKATCGGTLTDLHGVIQTPAFPSRFPVPIRCQWVIDASNVPSNNATIVVYLTQLYVLKGLTFTEFAFYDSSAHYGYGGRLIHTVTERNVTKVRWIQPRTMFLVIDFHMKQLEGNQLRALDGLLDVYGFNITYEISTKHEPVNPNSCSVTDCSFVGNCFAATNHSKFWCECFEGFSGLICGHGPLCEEGRSQCQNGATCRHAGANAVICYCPPGFNGTNCGSYNALDDNTDNCGETECVFQCTFNGRPENVCNCPRQSRVSTDRARFEGIVRLASIPAFRDITLGREQLALLIERLLDKYMKTSNLSGIEDLRVLQISSGEEVTFHFFGVKKDGNRVRAALNRLVQRGRLGNLTFVPTHLFFQQEPTLLIQSVQVNQPRVIRQGDEFIISCVAQGSSYMTFQWYKDGIFVNTTKAIRTIWSHLQPLDANGRYTATLGISKASSLDGGLYTCQVEDWGIQQCKSLAIEVRRPPEVEINPKSITVQKGDNVSIVCISPNDRSPDVFGYNWTKNKLLFKMRAGTEVWEELFPVGSILKISNVQKSAIYSCEVIGYVTTTVDVRVEVLNKTTVPLCPEDINMSIAWSETSPGAYCIKQCPPRFIGEARRLCTLRDMTESGWDLPDFSACFSETLLTIHNNFRRLTYGYQNTTGVETLTSYLHYLDTRSGLFPGEGERMLDMVHEVSSYMNATQANDEVHNATWTLYCIMDALLKQENSIMAIMKVVQLQRLAHSQALLNGDLLIPSQEIHENFDTITFDIARLDSTILNNIHLPYKENRYPWWFADKMDVRIESSNSGAFGNSSFTLAVVAYKNLSSFLPVRSVLQMRNGNDVEYEIRSRLVSVSVGRERGLSFSPPRGTFWIDIELHHVAHNYSWQSWNTTCAVADFAGTSWDMESCSTVALNGTLTRCTCTRTGVYAILLTTKTSHMVKIIVRNQYHLVIQVGCICCLVQSLIAMGVLMLYWWYHQSCVAYLKVQCCAAAIGAMVVFLYAICNDLSVESYPYITTFLETFLLVGMSSHLSKILIVYTELVQMPKLKRLKPTVLAIITGVPVIAIFGNHLAHRSMGRQLESWWLLCGTLSFHIFVTSSLVMVILFVFLYLNVMHKLRVVAIIEITNTKILHKRIRLLRRSALLFLTICIMVTASIVYVNVEDTLCNYFFSSSCIALGFLQLMCYVVKSESSLYSHMSTKLKLPGIEQDISSESANSPPFRFFTKQEPDAENECECEPQLHQQRITKGRLNSKSKTDLPKLNISVAEGDSSKTDIYQTSTAEYWNTTDQSELKLQQVEKEIDVDLELYNRSPKMYQKSPINAALYSESEKMYHDHWYLQDSVIIQPTSTVYLSHPPDILTAPVCVELDILASQKPLVESHILAKSSSISFGNAELKSNKNVPSNSEIVEGDDHLDGMLDRISHDLDYLLNRSSVLVIPIVHDIKITPIIVTNHEYKSKQIKDEDEDVEVL